MDIKASNLNLTNKTVIPSRKDCVSNNGSPVPGAEKSWMHVLFLFLRKALSLICLHTYNSIDYRCCQLIFCDGTFTRSKKAGGSFFDV